MQEPSIGIRVSVECSTTTTAQQREDFDRVFGHYGMCGVCFRRERPDSKGRTAESKSCKPDNVL
jgi:hypothetical protein